jgi:hypothetical protein
LNCTERTKNVSIGGNGEFIGVLVATYADLTMSGGGKSKYDFIGSALVNSAKLNGHYSFHYDEASLTLGGL